MPCRCSARAKGVTGKWSLAWSVVGSPRGKVGCAAAFASVDRHPTDATVRRFLIIPRLRNDHSLAVVTMGSNDCTLRARSPLVIMERAPTARQELHEVET